MTKLEKLKEKFDNKVDKEFMENLKQCTPEVIIERAYEKVSKEEIIYNLKDKEYTVEELKALLKVNGILEECYDEWSKSNGNFHEVSEYAVDKRLHLIIEDFKEKNKKEKER